jgi:HEAT repeat protein
MVAESRGWDWAKLQVEDFEGDVDAWIEAVELLDRLATPERLGDLEVMLRHEVFCVREAAATPYARLLGAAALPLLLEAKNRGTEDGHDNDSLCAVIQDIVAHHKAETAPVLAKMMYSENARDRAHAAWLWACAEPEVQADPLLEALRDQDPNVRGSAAGSLSIFKGDTRVLPALLAASNDADPDVRVDVVSALGYLGDCAALPMLNQALKDATEKVRRFAEHAIRMIERPSDAAT